jgi:3-oxoacyl-[acyl-carrier protein] reductase
MGLADKAVVVTGAAHGIGRAYSERLAADGASVALLDIDAKRNEEVASGICAKGGKAIAIATDVRDFTKFKAAVDQAAKTFGKLTGIVNNAGMLNVVPITRCMFEDIPDAEWDESFRLNTKSAWYGCKAARSSAAFRPERTTSPRSRRSSASTGRSRRSSARRTSA